MEDVIPTEQIVSYILHPACLLQADGTMASANDQWQAQEFSKHLQGKKGESIHFAEWYMHVPGVNSEQLYVLVDGIASVLDGTSTGYLAEFSAYVRQQPRFIKLAVLPVPHGRYKAMLVHEDVTETLNAIEKLRQNERELSAYFELPLVGFALLGSDGTWLKVNDTLCSMTGYRREELLALRWQDLTLEDDIPGVTEYLDRVMKGTNPPVSFEKRYRHKNGSLVFVELSAARVHSPGAEPKYFVTLVQDSTSKLQRAAEIREKQRLLESIANAVPQMVFLFDVVEHTIVYANTHIATIMGKQPDEITNMGADAFDRLFSAEERKRIEEQVAKLSGAPDGTVVESEDRLVAKGGRRKDCVIRCTAFQRNEDGRLLYALVTISDVTGMRKAERNLAGHQAILNTMVNSISDLIFYKDRNGVYRGCNDAVFAFLGLDQKDIYGHTVFEIFPKDVAESIARGDSEALDTKTALVLDETLQNAEGKTFVFETIKTPVVDADGTSLGIISVRRDVTLRRKMEDELRFSRQQAVQSDKLKNAFIANISHEIRTPLNIVLGFLGIIKDRIHPESDVFLHDCFGRIEAGAERLMRTMEGILSVSRFQSGAFVLNKEVFDLAPLIRMLVERAREQAYQKKLTVECHDDGQPTLIKADPQSIEQAFMNLLDNAVKFTEEGVITVRIFPEDDFVCIDIGDTGVGMSEEYLEQVFNRFSQEEGGYSRPFEGLGLGLALVRLHVEANNGSIVIQTRKGEGTLVTVRLPVHNEQNRGSVPVNAPATLVSGKGLASNDDTGIVRILVVDDDDETLRYMRIILTQEYDVVTSSEPETVMQILDKYRIDLILMDISLGYSQDGLEITSRIRLTEPHSDIPIIAVTAHSLPEDRQRCLDAGCTDYLAKPFERDDLFEKLRACLSDGRN